MIEISNYSCGYGSRAILNNIDVRINKGEFIGIIGPNGSGKTTLLRAVTLLVKPFGGVIHLDGKDIRETGFKELAQKIAVVSQAVPSTIMTVGEYVLLGRLPHYSAFQLFETGKDVEVAEYCMEITDTIKFKDRYISQLSSGEAQLVLIARALAQEPLLLLLDEPTAHLDITHQVSILDMIKRLNKEYGLTIIIVLHDLNLAAEYCDRLILMDKGSVRKAGRPEEVLNYADIEEVYKTVVVVETNPLSSKPFVLVVPEEVKKKCRR